MQEKNMIKTFKDQKEVQEREEVHKEKEAKKNGKEKKSKTKKQRNDWFLAFLRRADVPKEKEETKNAKNKSKTKKLRRNRFVAFLQRAWRAFTGCLRCRTSSPQRSSEEVPGPRSGINTVDIKASRSSDVEEPQNMKAEDYKIEEKNGLESAKNRQRAILESSPSRGNVLSTEQDMEDQGSNEDQTPGKKLSSDNGSQDSEVLASCHAEQDMKDDKSEYVTAMSYQERNKAQTSDKKLSSDNGSPDSEVLASCHAEQDMKDDKSEYVTAMSYQERNKAQTSDKKLSSDSCSSDLEHLSYYTVKEIIEDLSLEEENFVSAVLPIQSHILEESSNLVYNSLETPPGSQSEIRFGEESNQSDAPAPQPLSLDSFTLLKMLGKGAHGMVILARDTTRKEAVALKVLDKSKFLQNCNGSIEHDILQLSHESPYLIHSLAAFQTVRSLFYVLEYVPRGDLQHFLRNNFPLHEDTVRFIMAELICGTQFLHNLGIIHRDLKLSNILLASDGHIKITDFGLAKNNVYNKIECWGVVGTPGHQAPEIIQGEAYGCGVDYFSIGVVFYQLCRFYLPFLKIGSRGFAQSIKYGKPYFPRTMPSCTKDIIESLLCKNQFQRLGVNGDVKEHPYFSNVNWEDIQLKRVEPPAQMTAEEDERPNFKPLGLDEFEENKMMFQDFSYVASSWAQQYYPKRLFAE